MATKHGRSGELAGRTAFIAGAGRNNGRAIALAFAREGADLVLVARKRKEHLDAVATECEASGAQVAKVLADLTDEHQVADAVKRGSEALGPLDTLVSVLAIRPHESILDTPPSEWRKIMDVNLNATYMLARALLPSMIERGFGNIIALGGVSALRALPGRPGVNASKYGLYGLIQSIAVDHGHQGVRANMVAPGFIRNRRENPEWYPEAVAGTTHTDEQIEATPLRREGTPEEVAEVALFLASERSSFVTGDCVVCAGGRQL